MTHDTREVEEETVEQANIRFANQNIWKTLPFTKGFIERHADNRENAECILKKLDEYHQEVVSIFHHQLQKAREEEREKIAEMLSKAGDNKISMLDDDNFTGTYWISLNDAYRLLTGRQVNHDWEEGKIEKNATVEMVIRKSINPDQSELDQDKALQDNK